jgi:hypothetical protein
MRIVYVEIKKFRGIPKLRWTRMKVNCLIGPGDSAGLMPSGSSGDAEFGPVPLHDLDLSVCYSTVFNGT